MLIQLVGRKLAFVHFISLQCRYGGFAFSANRHGSSLADASQQPSASDTPDSVGLQQFAVNAGPQAYDQGRRSQSSPHVPVIFGSPVCVSGPTFRNLDIVRVDEL